MSTRFAEKLVCRIVDMDRMELARTLRALPVGFKMDFTDEALNEMDLSRLQHIVLAAALCARKGKPTL